MKLIVTGFQGEGKTKLINKLLPLLEKEYDVKHDEDAHSLTLTQRKNEPVPDDIPLNHLV